MTEEATMTTDETSTGAGYTLRVETGLPYDEAVTRVRGALAEEGFGVLTEIDVRATLRAKLGVEVPAQVILGACRPELAHRAMTAAPSIAALLPCNVVVREHAGATVVEAIDPAAMTRLDDNPAIAEVAADARARLGRALDRLEVA